MYEEIVALSKPYYEKGRLGDELHIIYLQNRLSDLEQTVRNEGYDFDVLFALTILHDVGYAKLPKGYDPYDLKIRKLHAGKSAEIAKVILSKVNFPKTKLPKTLRLIKHHDDWAFSKPLKDPEWRIFTDLDFAWEASIKGFDIVRSFLNQNRKEFLETVKQDYSRKQKSYPFYLSTSKQLFLKDLSYWKKRLSH
jgi:hypothetical protein